MALRGDCVGLDENLKEKLTQLLESQIAGILSKIDEEVTSNNSEI